MNRVRQTRARRSATRPYLMGVVAALVLLGGPDAALAGGDPHEVSWGHSVPSSVQSFIVFISPESGALDLARQVDVGVPAGQSLGTLRLYTAIVASDEDEFIAVAALGRNGLLSPLAAWSAAQPSQPGQPALVVP